MHGHALVCLFALAIAQEREGDAVVLADSPLQTREYRGKEKQLEERESVSDISGGGGRRAFNDDAVVVLVHRAYKPTTAQIGRIIAAYEELLTTTLEWMFNPHQPSSGSIGTMTSGSGDIGSSSSNVSPATPLRFAHQILCLVDPGDDTAWIKEIERSVEEVRQKVRKVTTTTAKEASSKSLSGARAGADVLASWEWFLSYKVVVTVDHALTTAVLPLWYSMSVPMIYQVKESSSIWRSKKKKWQWLAADLWIVVWWGSIGGQIQSTDTRLDKGRLGKGVRYVWEMEQDTAWSGRLTDILTDPAFDSRCAALEPWCHLGSSIDTAHPTPPFAPNITGGAAADTADATDGAGAAGDGAGVDAGASVGAGNVFTYDFLGQDCAGPTTTADKAWGRQASSHTGWLDSDGTSNGTLPGVYHCQIPVSRYSDRLLDALLKFHAAGTHWAYCEITPPSVAIAHGWSIADYKELAPYRFGPFDWNEDVDAKQLEKLLQGQGSTSKGTGKGTGAPHITAQFFHRLKWR
jgi:hypothetical protein